MRCNALRTTNSGAVFFCFTLAMLRLRWCFDTLSATFCLLLFQDTDHTGRNGITEKWRDCIANLAGNFDFTSFELEVIWKRLKSSCLSMCNWTVLFRMEITPLFWLKKLGPDSERWAIPP